MCSNLYKYCNGQFFSIKLIITGPFLIQAFFFNSINKNKVAPCSSRCSPSTGDVLYWICYPCPCGSSYGMNRSHILIKIKINNRSHILPTLYVCVRQLSVCHRSPPSMHFFFFFFCCHVQFILFYIFFY